jgi:heterodisulfide reductase subunit A
MKKNGEIRIGVYICHCGINISHTVDVQTVRDYISKKPYVVIAKDYKFMCSDPGQEMIRDDIHRYNLNRIIVAACSPQMHELTFRKNAEEAGLNRYLVQIANIREHCSWIHENREEATEKAIALVNAAVKRVKYQIPLIPLQSPVNPNVAIVGAGIAGIQAALEIAESGRTVYLVERESTIGGQIAKFDKTFPTLDCASCILTPKMVSISHRKNIHLFTLSEVKTVSGYFGNFKIKIEKKPRYVDEKCTSCGECAKVCPVRVPNWFDHNLSNRTAIHKAFPQAVPNTYVIDKQERPPCKEACPIGQDAAGYVSLIREGRFTEAIKLIRTKNPLPVICGRVCYHPCESECNRGYVDSPIAIQHLKRFATDWEMRNELLIEPKVPEIKRDEKVAVIGSGPAGLVCAHDLAAKGFKVTVFEALSIPGGMLAVGIPEYRLPKRLLNFEIDFIKRMGVSIKTDSKFGVDFHLNNLNEQGYKAVFIATGAHKGVSLNISGEHFRGVYQGIEYLRKYALGIPVPLGNRVAIIGGGNTAIDCARTAIRSGIEKVMILYRRTRAEMPALPEEISDAEDEGIQFIYLVAPVEVLVENDRVKALRCEKMQLGEPDASGRRRPIPIPGSEFEIELDSIIAAIGQTPDVSLFKNHSAVALTRNGTIEVNSETLQTDIPGVFAGGDVCLGPSTVIAAMGMGKRAAESIEKYLNKQPLDNFLTHMVQPRYRRGETFRPHSYAPLYKDTPKEDRSKMPKLNPLDRKNDFREVELGFKAEDAVKEASRCLNCGVCVECYECVRVCEPNAIDHSMKRETVELEVGQILLTTGYHLFDPSIISAYGYGKYDNVITSLEFERIVSSTGPTNGKILLKNGKEPKAIAIVHCVGSRDENFHRYCSRVCCMYSLKFSHLVRERINAEVYNFYIDMRAFGKGYEEFYSRVLQEGANVVRGKVAEVIQVSMNGNKEKMLLVKCEDTLIGKYREIPVDMVILSSAIEPQLDSEDVRRIFGISRSPDGFFLERHPKLEPISTATDGIYIAGCAQGPKDIPDSVAQAGAAAARMLAIAEKGMIEIDPIRAEITEELCGGCRICNNLCPYSAISFIEEKKVSNVNSTLCKGCGTCVASCPAGAIAGSGFSDEQIYSELEGILEA